MNNSLTNNFFIHALKRHESFLYAYTQSLEIPALKIKEAMEYALFSGGKRLRPLLVYACGDIVNVSEKILDIIAASIELIHCYSLIHDDLPAMDNDDYRRGKPTCHRQYDEATAILVGDALQSVAIELLLNQLPSLLPLNKTIAITKELLKASGPNGMISGQSLDLTELSKPTIKENELTEIHFLKTGKLMIASMNMVLAAGDPSQTFSKGLTTFAYHVGIAFQMQDDYLDKYGETRDKLGKKRASDTVNNKNTFATLYSEQKLIERINHHYQLAKEELQVLNQEDSYLHDLLEYMYQRMR